MLVSELPLLPECEDVSAAEPSADPVIVDTESATSGSQTVVARPQSAPPGSQLVAAGLARQTEALRQAITQHLAEAQHAIANAFDRKVFDGRRAKRPSFEQAFAELLDGSAAGEWPRGKLKLNGKEKTLHIDKLAPAQLRDYCKDGQSPPVSPLFDALQAWFDADDLRRQWLQRQRVQLLHQLRDQARQRLARYKQQHRLQTYDDLIDGVHAALAAEGGAVLAERLRAQYRFALVDEFQDTDPRQWDIFRQVFAEPAGQAALFLIGDPKQAIYGFRGGDVHTYLQARERAAPAPRLGHNFRSRPSVLRAIDALYANAEGVAFRDPRISFEPVQAGGKRSDDDYLLDGGVAPALTLQLIETDNEEGKPLKADDSRAAATHACVADIHRVLSAARRGQALIGGKPVQPGDIAVLVRSHKEATRIQQALAAVGIAAVAAGKHSLFASAEAHELRLLLLALLQPADEGRLRAALATVLLGESAAAIAALERDGDDQRRHQERLLQWRERWQRGGVLAMLSDLCAEQAQRLLALVDGERRLTNYLQLGELLQEAGTRSIGLHGLLDWLQARITHADAGDDTQLLRLESDARRVQIITLHKSKGLEYPLVYLPFVGIDGNAPDNSAHRTVHDGQQRVLHWKIDKDAEAWKTASAQASNEDAAEAARLLYVGLTRAEHALWIAGGALAGLADSPLGPMLGAAGLEKLAANPDVRIIKGELPAWPQRLPPEQEPALPAVRRVQRVLSPDWWVYSFTQLAHAEAGHATAAAATEADGGADDEPAQAQPDSEDAAETVVAEVFDPRFAGSRFGNVLHAVLENTDFNAWAGWQPGAPAPAGQAEVIADALRAEGYAADAIDDGVALLTGLAGQTLGVALPEGGALHDLGNDERRAEIEFHFAMQATAVPALLRVLHAHGVVRGRRGFGPRARLEGLMTGKIDLTYVRDGRWYVLDYKSNRLPAGYAPAQLEVAMRHSEYDLQALIYTVALHRWLRFRLGEGYDYARDFGGIRYLFCRGLDMTRNPSPGIHAQRFAPELVQAVDELFAGHAPTSSATPTEPGA